MRGGKTSKGKKKKKKKNIVQIHIQRLFEKSSPTTSFYDPLPFCKKPLKAKVTAPSRDLQWAKISSFPFGSTVEPRSNGPSSYEISFITACFLLFPNYTSSNRILPSTNENCWSLQIFWSLHLNRLKRKQE